MRPVGEGTAFHADVKSASRRNNKLRSHPATLCTRTSLWLVPSRRCAPVVPTFLLLIGGAPRPFWHFCCMKFRRGEMRHKTYLRRT